MRTAGAHGAIIVDPIVQAGQLLAADGTGGDGLGQAVAVSGTLIAVGAPDATVGGQGGAGAVYVFNRAGQRLGQREQRGEADRMPTPGGAAQLGTSVAISGTTVLAGAPNATVAGRRPARCTCSTSPPVGWASETESGTAHLSEPRRQRRIRLLDGRLRRHRRRRRTLLGRLRRLGLRVHRADGRLDERGRDGGADAPTRPGSTGLGFSVGVDGGTVAVGAPLANSLPGYVDEYSEPSGGWANETETALLSTSDGAAQDGLGQSVGVSGNTVVAGRAGRPRSTRTPARARSTCSTVPASGWADWHPVGHS